MKIRAQKFAIMDMLKMEIIAKPVHEKVWIIVTCSKTFQGIFCTLSVLCLMTSIGTLCSCLCYTVRKTIKNPVENYH